ncbi:hypothetical protein TNCV_3955551 [Trichonephila clavipes]|nr:hypothetical protein TNCV_3955551 [Trichonephila clavipes]
MVSLGHPSLPPTDLGRLDYKEASPGLSEERDEAPIVTLALRPGPVVPCLKTSLHLSWYLPLQTSTPCQRKDFDLLCRG